jgi:hypothetical protein
VTLGEDIAAHLPGLRQQAESLMFDIALVERPGHQMADEETGEVTTTWTPLYDGPARRRSREGQALAVEVAGSTQTVTRYEAHFPVGSFAPRVGDRITWKASRFDPHLPGKVDQVVSLLHATAATAYRLSVKEVT